MATGDLYLYLDTSGNQQRVPLPSTAFGRAVLAYTSAAVFTTNSPVWVKYTKTYSDLSTAGATNDIELFSLAAKEVIHNVIIKHSTAFSGGLIATYTLSVGIIGNLVKYAAAFNVFQAVSATTMQTSVLAGMESSSGATSIRLSAVSTVGLLNAATAGVVDVWVLKSTLP